MQNKIFFHLAIPIYDINLAKKFYSQGLGCDIGRETAYAIIFNFYDNQLVAHITQEKLTRQKGIYPRHFGLVFENKNDFNNLITQAKNQQLSFYQEPKLRFPGKEIEHWTFFLEDPFYNFLEFKFYCHQEAIFKPIENAVIGDR